MQQPPLDFDFQSTTPCLKEVIEAMEPYWKDLWGNPSNRQNRAGIHVSAAISVARDKLASILGVQPQRLIFTSGATEANNLALIGCARAQSLKLGKPGHLISMATEHISVLDPLRQLKKEGFQITELKPRSDGILSLHDLEEAFQDDTFMVSIMLANNEIGVIQPLKEVSELCKEKGIILHSDAAQAFGHIPIYKDSLGIDLMTLSSHKIYGPKGIGVLVKTEQVCIQPLLWGGGQETGLRAGTLPVPLIIGFAKAAEIAVNSLEENNIQLRDLRDKLWSDLYHKIPNLSINGSLEKRLPNNLNFTIDGVIGIRLQKLLRSKINCSSASACTNGSPSHVLTALGRTKKESESSLRLSLGINTKIQDIENAVVILSELVSELRS